MAVLFPPCWKSKEERRETEQLREGGSAKGMPFILFFLRPPFLERYGMSSVQDILVRQMGFE